MASQYSNTYKTNSSNIDRGLFKLAMKAPMLEKEHELDLARRWRDNQDKRALDELTQSYLRLVISTANRFKNYGLPLTDLVQEGTVGLMEAASRFDPERDLRFSTYSNWWIRSSMQDYVLRNWSIVRTGTTAAQKSLFFNLRRLQAAIETEIEGPITPKGKETIARDLGVRIKDVNTMEARLSGHDHSLNAPLNDETGSEWQDTLPSTSPTPDKVVMEEKDSVFKKSLIANALENLNEREVIIINERQLTDNIVTLAALGERLGISKERVRQIECQALGKLKTNILDRMGDNISASAGIAALI